MNQKLLKYLVWVSIGLMNIVLYAQSNTSSSTDNELVTFATEDGGVIEATYFSSGYNHAVVFAHGAIFNKESWYFIAEKLQKEGIASLSLDFRGYGNSKKGTSDKKSLDVLGAVNFLKERKFKKVSIVGGSMGAAAVLSALNAKPGLIIDKIVLLAPAGGKAITSKSIKKLFIVSKDERLFSRVTTIFNESQEPKELKVYPGTAHAQHMFKEEYSDELTHRIIQFLKGSN